MRFIRLLWITTRPGRAWVGSVTNKHNPSTESGLGACISSRITTVIHVWNDHQINYNCFNEPFAVSPYWSLYWDMHGLIFETSIWLLAGSTRFVHNHWKADPPICFSKPWAHHSAAMEQESQTDSALNVIQYLMHRPELWQQRVGSKHQPFSDQLLTTPLTMHAFRPLAFVKIHTKFHYPTNLLSDCSYQPRLNWDTRPKCNAQCATRVWNHQLGDLFCRWSSTVKQFTTHLIRRRPTDCKHSSASRLCFWLRLRTTQSYV